MASILQRTLQWLHDVLNKDYRDLNRTYADLAVVLERFPSLAPRTDVYTFENGVSALLVHLVGTIPVAFRNVNYRIPTELWIPYGYPQEPPIVYVTATPEILIRPGRHVSGEGRIYHPYLARWSEAWGRSTVTELLSILCDTFSREPPVTSRQQSPKQVQQPATPPAILPHTPARVSENDSASRTQNADDRPPALPPKQQVSADPSNQPRSNRPLGRYDAPPPLPEAAQAASKPSIHPQAGAHGFQEMYAQQSKPQPPIRSQTMPQSQYFHRPGTTSVGGHLRQPPPSTNSVEHVDPVRIVQPPSAVQEMPYPQQSPRAQPMSTAGSSMGIRPIDHQKVHVQNLGPNQISTQMSGQRQQQQYHQWQPAISHPPAKPPSPINLMDSPFDLNLPGSSSSASTSLPVPPVPPNPEKDAMLSSLSNAITQTLHKEITTATSSLPLLQSQNQALTNTLQTLESELSHLQSLQTTLMGNVTTLQSSMRDADVCISSAHNRAQRGDIPAVDDMLVAPTVVGKQLYDVVCEERAIEAAVWALQVALTKGRVGPEVWARKTRELRREQFRRKVLVGKIAEGMGLEM